MASLVCPRCGAPATGGTCAMCGADFTDPRVQRLAEINRAHHDLMTERDRLLRDLAGPPAPPTGSPVIMPPPGGLAPPPKAGAAGQHVLLTLGALLLLGAGSVFVLAVWLVVGRYGQAALLAAGVTGAVVGSFALARRALTASAETVAALGIGFAVILSQAAHGWNLLGLGTIPHGWYETGEFALLGAGAGVTSELARRRRPLRAYVWASVGGFGVSALIAVARTLEVTSPEPGRYAAAALLVAYAAGVVAIVRRWPSARAEAIVTSGWIAAGLVGFALFVPLADAPYEVLVLVALAVAAGASTGLLVMDRLLERWWPAAALVAVLQALTWGLLALTSELGVRGNGSYRAALLDQYDPSGRGVPVWALTVAAVAWALTALAAVVRFRTREPWGVVSCVALELLGTFALGNGLVHAPARVVAWVAVAYVAAQVALAAWSIRSRARAREHWAGVEMVAAVAMTLGSFVAAGFAGKAGHGTVTAVLASLAVLAAAYAAFPSRRGRAYLAAVLASLAWWSWLDGGVVVEAYTLPSAAFLAVAGLAYGIGRPTILTAGPALAMALLPTMFHAVGVGDPWRLGVVTVIGAALVLAGVSARLLGPLVVGAVAVVVVVVTQGGPYVAVVPYWITGGLLGILFVAIGIAWERAVALGRRSAAWLSTLR